MRDLGPVGLAEEVDVSLRTSSAILQATRERLVREEYGPWHSRDAVVCWGSVTKVLVAARARALLSDTRSAESVTVSDLTGVAAPASLSVSALITHRSGLPCLLPEQRRMVADPYGPFDDDRFDRDVLGRLAELTEPPTSAPLYSNLGYAVLTRALELGFGRPWVEMLGEAVLVPTGLPVGSVTTTPDEASQGGVVRARRVSGAPLDDWDLSRGPFSGAGGAWASPATMAGLALSAAEPGSPLDPRTGLTAWVGAEPFYWHNGAVLRSGAMVVVDLGAEQVTLGHSVGGRPLGNAQKAESLVAAALVAGRESGGVR